MIAWYDCRISTGKKDGINNKNKVMRHDKYDFGNERCFNLRHYMHSMTVASPEMSDESDLKPNDRFGINV